MIDFIEEKIREALQHTTSAKAALEEASGAIAPMKERLTKEENDPLIAALCFEIFYVDLKRMDKAQLNAFIERLQVARRLVARFTE